MEFELFRQHRQLMSNSYHRAARRLVFSLRQNQSLRCEVRRSKDCISRLVTDLRCGRQLTDDGLAQGSQATAVESGNGS